jgi:hypothetical protein
MPFDSFRETCQQMRGGLVEGRPLLVHDALVRFDGIAQDDLGVVDAKSASLI